MMSGVLYLHIIIIFATYKIFGECFAPIPALQGCRRLTIYRRPQVTRRAFTASLKQLSS